MALAAGVWAFLAVMWGTTWMVASVALREIPPFSLAGARFLLASALLFLVVKARRSPLPLRPGEWLLTLGTGASSIGLTYAFQFWGMQYVASGLAAVVFSTVPLLTTVLAHWILPGEPVTLRKGVGVLAGIAGVTIIFADQLGASGGLAPWAILGFGLGALSLAHAQVMIKAHGRATDPVVLAAFQTLVGGALLLAVGAVVEGNPLRLAWSGSSLAALGYLSVLGTGVGFVALYWLLQRLPVTTVNSMMLVHPLVAMTLGAAVLGERLTWHTAVGAAAIVLGLAAILLPASRLRRPTPRAWRTDELPVAE